MNDITPSLDREKAWQPALDTLDDIERRAHAWAWIDDIERRVMTVLCAEEDTDPAIVEGLVAEFAEARAELERVTA